MSINQVSWEVDGDIGLDSNGQMALLSEGDQVSQNIVQRLRSFEGEFYLDRDHGVPYFQRIFVLPTNVPLIESILKRQIIETKGVLSLLRFKISIDVKSRILSAYDIRVSTVFGIISIKKASQ